MIRNLNQVNFGSYGSVLPERAHSATPIPREEMESIALDSDCAPIYQAQSNTWICGSTGMTILSVCSGEDEYLHFYLDKPVSLKRVCSSPSAPSRAAPACWCTPRRRGRISSAPRPCSG